MANFSKVGQSETPVIENFVFMSRILEDNFRKSFLTSLLQHLKIISQTFLFFETVVQTVGQQFENILLKSS